MNCIEATGFKSPKGYCRAQLNGKRYLAHRVSYVLSRGISIEDINGYLVCHKCDNPSCINPDHLFLGTNKDNLDDMREKGRGKSPRFVGEDHPSRKLSNADITHIRDMHGLYTQRSLASIWKISQSQVGRILRKESWEHIPSVDGVKEGSAHDRRN